MLIVTTAAGGDATYGETGRTGVSLADVFTPMKASALHGNDLAASAGFQRASRDQLPEYQRQLVERLKN